MLPPRFAAAPAERHMDPGADIHLAFAHCRVENQYCAALPREYESVLSAFSLAHPLPSGLIQSLQTQRRASKIESKIFFVRTCNADHLCQLFDGINFIVLLIRHKVTTCLRCSSRNGCFSCGMRHASIRVTTDEIPQLGGSGRHLGPAALRALEIQPDGLQNQKVGSDALPGKTVRKVATATSLTKLLTPCSGGYGSSVHASA